MESSVESADRTEIDGKEIEEERALRLGGERDELSPRIGFHLAVDVLEICRLTAETRAVIDDLAVDLARRVVDHRHRSSISLPVEQLVDLVAGTGEDVRLSSAALSRSRERAVEVRS